MRRSFWNSFRPWCWTPAHRVRHQRALCIPVERASPSGDVAGSIEAFRQTAFQAETPLHFKNAGVDAIASHRLPASEKWFSASTAQAPRGLAQYLDEHLDWPFPFEVAVPGVDEKPAVVAFRDWIMESSDPTDQMLAGILHATLSESNHSKTFFQLFAPLKLLKKALEFNQARFEEHRPPLMLYIAQSSLSDLPSSLRDDLPTPELVKHAGKGDVYNSSIWLGTEPTYTPLHRDPNPNLFMQLCSDKVVRLLPPDLGDRVFFDVQVQIRQQGGATGNSRIRSTEMMEGAERAILHEVIWANPKLEDELYEAKLTECDDLFIPKGWWHSVKSVGSEGHLNASANWWFR